MKIKILILLLFLMLPASMIEAGVTSDSLSDIFPLAVGNQWTYRFQSAVFDEFPDVHYADTGIVTYLVTAVITASDSLRWLVRENRDLTSYYYSPGDESPKADTSFTVVDAHSFEIVELLNGKHPIYRTPDSSDNQPGGSVIQVFPFTPGFADSTTLYRYAVADSAHCANIIARENTDGHASILYRFIFKEGVGELSVAASGGLTTIPINTDHTLQSYTILSVNDPPQTVPSEYALFQNYPNPFNGSTQIQFSMPHAGPATLTLFDPLGRKISLLFHGMAQAGVHRISLSSESLASGMYFYQLSSGNTTVTRRLVLIK